MYCMKSTNFLYSVFLVITAVAGAWNLRQVMLTGQSNRLHRLLYKIMDEAAMKVRKAQQSGKNVSCLQLTTDEAHKLRVLHERLY